MRRQRAPGRSLKEWVLLIEAGFLLLVARSALRLFHTAQIVRWVRRPLRTSVSSVDEREVRLLQWAVTAFSRNAPIRLVCFPQALAMYTMLRRRRVLSEVLYGVARLPEGKLVSHAWLRIEDRIWIGGEVAAEFTVLDVWTPSPHPSPSLEKH